MGGKGVVATPAGRLLLRAVQRDVQAPELLPAGGEAQGNRPVLLGRGCTQVQLDRSWRLFGKAGRASAAAGLWPDALPRLALSLWPKYPRRRHPPHPPAPPRVVALPPRGGIVACVAPAPKTRSPQDQPFARRLCPLGENAKHWHLISTA
ncbi:hypothetical protein RNZ50_11325 [Paracoccaceae bacterium Fryx2]|nr:hypothetical protein [Paracoccaceae bacterium Fryx2]